MSKTVYYNGDIVTVNRDNQVAGGLLVEDGKIAAVGSQEEILALADRDTVKIDLEGRALLPGFIDPHSHIAMVSQAMLYLDLSGCGSISQLLDLLRTRLRDGLVKPGEWIIGSGYDNTRFPGQQHPTKFDLDSVTAEVPIFLSHTSGHLAAVNSAALQRLGYVGQDYAVPAGGVVRTVSPDSREPNGILEENACLAPEKKTAHPRPHPGDAAGRFGAGARRVRRVRHHHRPGRQCGQGGPPDAAGRCQRREAEAGHCGAGGAERHL